MLSILHTTQSCEQGLVLHIIMFRFNALLSRQANSISDNRDNGCDIYCWDFGSLYSMIDEYKEGKMIAY